MIIVLRGRSKCGTNNLCLGKDGRDLTKRKYSNKETMCSLFDTFINHVYGCWLIMGQHEWKTVRERVDKIFFLTSLRDNLRWLFCWGPLLCRGTEQCRRWYSSASHSQSETGSPEKESQPQVISWLRKPQQTNHISNWATVSFLPTFLGSMLNFLRPMATCLFLCIFFL